MYEATTRREGYGCQYKGCSRKKLAGKENEAGFRGGDKTSRKTGRIIAWRRAKKGRASDSNRRYLEETLEREIQRSMRTQSPLGIIMLDVNHFKQINDRLGHATGDMVLREMGRFLAAQIQKADVACRYGGDEFVFFCLTPHKTRQGTGGTITA